MELVTSASSDPGIWNFLTDADSQCTNHGLYALGFLNTSDKLSGKLDRRRLTVVWTARMVVDTSTQYKCFHMYLTPERTRYESNLDREICIREVIAIHLQLRLEN